MFLCDGIMPYKHVGGGVECAVYAGVAVLKIYSEKICVQWEHCETGFALRRL